MKTKWTNGVIQRYAGTGIAGYSGDCEMADIAQLNGPAGLAIDKDDNVFIVEIHNSTVRKIDAKTGIISTVAGCGERGFDGDGELAIKAKLNGPEGVFVDDSGNIYISDSNNERIRKVDSHTGIINTVAGTGEAGYNGDNIKAEDSKLNHPSGVVVDKKGNIYIGDYRNDRIRKVSSDGIISTFAGTGIYGYSGDNGPADKAQINDVYGLAIDVYDNIYIVDSLNFAIRKVEAKSGIISTVFGKGEPGQVEEFINVNDGYISGEKHDKGKMGTKVPHAVEVNKDGYIFISDTDSNRIRIVDYNQNLVYTIVGNGKEGCSGDGGFALDACIGVHGLRIDSNNNLYFLDYYNHVVRVVKFTDLDENDSD